MSTVLEAPPIAARPPSSMRAITCNAETRIPASVHDLASFRQWADSPEYPDTGKFHYLQGELWVELDMEELFSHNLLKTRITSTLDGWCESSQKGYCFSDGVRLTNSAVDLSSEPDAVFVSYAAVQSGKVKLVRGRAKGFVELDGSPELVVEIVSRSSVQKDTVLLKRMYAEARMAEYWIVDARKPQLQFDLLVLGANGYAPAELRDGIPVSPLLGKRVAIDQSADPLGNPQFTVHLAEQ